MSKVRVLVTIPELKDEEELLDEIRQVSPKIELVYKPCRTREEVQKALDERVRVLYTWLMPLDLKSAPNLKWVQMHQTGVEAAIASPLWGSDVPITNVHTHAILMSEYTIGCMIALSRGFFQLARNKDSRAWNVSGSPPNELRRKTIGMVGYGGIGRATAALAHCLGMRILACKRNPEVARSSYYQWPGLGDPEGALPEKIYSPTQLRKMLPQCDFVVISVPSTSETRGILGSEELKCMKPTAYLINISRGEVIDEKALLQALREKWIAGAALDVFAHEPLSKDSEFWTLGDNVFVTPHISGSRYSLSYNRLTNEVFVENLRRYVQGKELINAVNKKLGY